MGDAGAKVKALINEHLISLGINPKVEPVELLAPDFLDRLEKANIWYRMEHMRDSVMIEVAIPGERWEVEFFEDGHAEVERFVSPGVIEDEQVLERLFAEDDSESLDGHS